MGLILVGRKRRLLRADRGESAQEEHFGFRVWSSGGTKDRLTWAAGCGSRGQQGVAHVGSRVWITWALGCGSRGQQGVDHVGTRVWLTWAAGCGSRGQQGVAHVGSRVCITWAAGCGNGGGLFPFQLCSVSRVQLFATPWTI